jgi:hypothetical protein
MHLAAGIMVQVISPFLFFFWTRLKIVCLNPSPVLAQRHDGLGRQGRQPHRVVGQYCECRRLCTVSHLFCDRWRAEREYLSTGAVFHLRMYELLQA